MYRSVLNSVQPIAASFDVKRLLAKDSVKGNYATVIDVTDFLNTDNDVFFFSRPDKAYPVIGEPTQ